MGDVLLDATEVAKYLGISRRTLEALIKHGDAPSFVWIGRQRRWRPQDVEEFITQKLPRKAVSKRDK
jgi:excisionase family DNA binding protein